MSRFIRALFLGLVTMVCAVPAYAGNDDVEIVEVKAAFEDVKQNVADAIIKRGYVIDYNAKIGDMLVRTGKDIGSTKKIYNGAETVQFCSALLTRKMMEADPENIAYCPYVIFYYERADRLGTIYVGYRELDDDGSDASETSKKAINKMLDEIIKEASGTR